MRKKARIFLYFILFFIAFLGFGTHAEAADALPPGYLVGDDTGLKIGTDGQYFIRHDDITPGLTFERKITISNYSNEEGTFEINFVMNPEDPDHKPTTSGDVDFLTAISVTLTYQGKQIYTGPIDGSGTPVANKKTAPIDLGKLETGEVRTIQADFKVSDEYPESAWKNVNKADFYWLFYAKREPTATSTTDTSTEPSDTDTSTGSGPQTGSSSSTPGKGGLGFLPQTGEDWSKTLFGAVIGMLMLCVILLIAKKKRNNR